MKEKNFEDTTEDIVKKLAKYTYVLPPKDIINNYILYKSFIKHYKSNIMNMLYEITSIILSPYILFVCYYYNTENIINYIDNHTTHDTKIGVIDRFSNFKENMEPVNSDLYRRREKSYLAFKSIYPSWNNGSSELNKYICNLSQYNEVDDFPSMYTSELFSSQT